MFKKLKRTIKRQFKPSRELLWAKIWDDTKRDIPWTQNLPSLSPGRSAVGYNYLYVMTRILNEMSPRKILDLGLGISTSLFSTYLSYEKYSDGLHMVAEHDQSWIDFYTANHSVSEYTVIKKQDLIRQKTKVGGGTAEYWAYADLGQDISGYKFDVISIDAPFGFGGKVFSEKNMMARRDVIPFLPGILNDSFVIVIDDYDRQGEKNTVKEIQHILESNSIESYTGVYEGMTDICVIASEDNKFLCSL